MQRLDGEGAEKCIRCRKRGKRLQIGVHNAIEQHMAIGTDKSAQENDNPANRQIFGFSDESQTELRRVFSGKRGSHSQQRGASKSMRKTVKMPLAANEHNERLKTMRLKLPCRSALIKIPGLMWIGVNGMFR